MTKVYIIDDQAAVRDAIAEMLNVFGFSPETFESAEDFLEDHAGSTPAEPGCIVCDVRMPGMSGIDLYRALAGHHRGRGAFIFITGDRASVSPEEGGTAGVPVLVKPFNAADLDAALTLAGIDTIA